MSGAFDGDFLIKSLFVLLFPKSISCNKVPMTGFCSSKLATSLNNRARGFSVLPTLFSIGSSLRHKLAWLCLPLVTQRSMSDCIPLA